MYSYIWNKKTGGYKLTTQTGKFVASEIRPVFAEELCLIGFDEHFKFDSTERQPLMWAKQNTYIYKGEVVAKLKKHNWENRSTVSSYVNHVKLLQLILI